MEILDVELGDRSYPIIVGSGLLMEPGNFLPAIQGGRAAVITNTTVAALYLENLRKSLVGIQAAEIVLPDGESYKNHETLNRIYDALMEERCDRGTTVIALGGGVVGDMAGYAAATYQRGIPFIQVPTTLLSQVDSSVGGKTGINHPLGKNMIGAFWQPRRVIIDTQVLNTLPDRELSAGLAEVIKYGLIRDLGFLEWIEANMDRLVSRDPVALQEAILRSCRNKAEVVARDERETSASNGRALLNLGHTFGHAIEAGLGFGTWLHGEAVAAGTVMAAQLSSCLGWIGQADVDRVIEVMVRAKLPTKGPRLGSRRYLELMGHDKKAINGRLRLVLLRRLGEAVTWAEASEEMICKAIDASCGD